MTAAEDRRRWAYGYLSRCATPPPAYGSPEWLALPDGPEKWAAAVRAAEAWASEGDYLIDDLRLEVELEREAFKAAEDADYQARRDAHRATWNRPDPRIAQEIDAEWREWMAGAE